MNHHLPTSRYIVKGRPEDGLDTLRGVFQASEGVWTRPIQRNLFLAEVSREQQIADKVRMADKGIISGKSLDAIGEETSDYMKMISSQGFEITECDIVDDPRRVDFQVSHDDHEALYIFAQAAQCKDGVRYDQMASQKSGKAVFSITEDSLSRDLQVAKAQGRELQTGFHNAVRNFQDDLYVLAQSGFSSSISYPEYNPKVFD